MRNLVLIPVLALAACATAPATTTSPTTRTAESSVASGGGTTYTVEVTTRTDVERVALGVPRQQAWEAMVAAYQALGLEITGADQANGALLVGSQRARGRLAGQSLTTLFDCGQGAAGPVTATYTLQVTIRGQVTPTQGGSQLETRVEANARDAATNNPPVTCATKGGLERLIAQEVRQRVGG
jgi:hypothetical protein